MSAVIEPSTGLEATPERAVKITAIRKRAKELVEAQYGTFMENPTEENYKELLLMLCHYQGTHPIKDKVL